VGNTLLASTKQILHKYHKNKFNLNHSSSNWFL